MKMYIAECPYCGRRTRTNKKLSEYGEKVLKYNKYVYLRCEYCQDKLINKHEIELLKKEGSVL